CRRRAGLSSCSPCSHIVGPGGSALARGGRRDGRETEVTAELGHARAEARVFGCGGLQPAVGGEQRRGGPGREQALGGPPGEQAREETALLALLVQAVGEVREEREQLERGVAGELSARLGLVDHALETIEQTRDPGVLFAQDIERKERHGIESIRGCGGGRTA